MLTENTGPCTGDRQALTEPGALVQWPCPCHVAVCVAGAFIAPPPEHGARLLFPPGDEGQVPSWKLEDRQ